MLSYLKQFNSSDYLPTPFNSQVENICQPVKAFKEPDTQKDNTIKALQQVKNFNQIRQEEFTNYTKVTRFKNSLLYQNSEQLRAKKVNISAYPNLRQSILAKAALASVTKQLEWPFFKIIEEISSSKIGLISIKKEEEICDRNISRSQSTLVKKDQRYFQAENKPQTISTQLHQTKKLRRNATLQKKVLLEIYQRLIGNNKKTIKWNPAQWFHKENITESDRSSWSNTQKIMTNKELIELIEPVRQFSGNRGNAGTYIQLTPQGEQLALQLLVEEIINILLLKNYCCIKPVNILLLETINIKLIKIMLVIID